MKKMKKYQSGSEVQGSKGSRASQIIAGISGAVAGAAGVGKNIATKRKARRAAQEEAQRYTNEKLNKTKSANEAGAKEFKTGGMVNSNKKISAIKSAGSKGVKSGVNKKATVKRK